MRERDINRTHPLTLVRLEEQSVYLEQSKSWQRKQSRTQLLNLEQGYVYPSQRWNGGEITQVEWDYWTDIEDFVRWLNDVMQEFPDGAYVLLARTRKGRYRSYARFDRVDGTVHLPRAYRYNANRKVRAVFLDLGDSTQKLGRETIKLAHRKTKIE